MTGLVMGFAGTPAALATDTARRLEAASADACFALAFHFISLHRATGGG